MTNVSPPQNRTEPSLVHNLTRAIKRWIEPVGIVPASDYHHIKLLTSILVIFIPLSVIALGLTLWDLQQTLTWETHPYVILILAAVFMLVTAYRISRTRYYRLAPAITVSIVIGAVLISAWIQSDISLLYYLAVGILLRSLFPPWRSTLNWLLAIILGLILLSIYLPAITPMVIVDQLYFFVTIGAIAMLYSVIQQRYLAMIEERSARLSRSEKALRQAHDELEMRVQERTAALEDANDHLQTEMMGRQQAELALRESEEKYRRLVNEANDGFFVTNLRGTLTFANQALAKIHGYDQPSDLMGHDFIEFIAPDMVDEIKEKFRNDLHNDHPAEMILAEIIRRDETKAFIEIKPAIIIEDGQVIGTQGIVRDITDRRQAEDALHQVNERLQYSVAELELRSRESALLTELSDLLQACTTTEEATRAIHHILPQLIKNSSGMLFTISPSRDDLEAILAWGQLASEQGQRMFEPDKCWALRRGQPHHANGICTASPCQTIPIPENFICVPMVAQAETVGVLHLRVEASGETFPGHSTLNGQLVINCAERIALALVNLRLSERLRNQSIRDPLTNLFNRRVMEEEFIRELKRAERANQSMGVIMLDLDHFKMFNDSFGHEAGDILLRELGAFLAANTRGGDVVCRYGGEEFVFILPDTSLADVHTRAEEIRAGVRNLSVTYHGQALGAITASVGLAGFPEHGKTPEALLHAADMAMYRAKAEGRNKVVLADPEPLKMT